MEERETIEEEEFEGDEAINLMLNFPVEEGTTKKFKQEEDFTHMIVNVNGHKGDKQQEQGTVDDNAQHNSKCGENATQENSAQEREDIAMLESCLNSGDGAKEHSQLEHAGGQEGAQAGAGGEATMNQLTEAAMQRSESLHTLSSCLPK